MVHWEGLSGQVTADEGDGTDLGYFEELSSLHHVPAQHQSNRQGLGNICNWHLDSELVLKQAGLHPGTAYSGWLREKPVVSL